VSGNSTGTMSGGAGTESSGPAAEGNASEGQSSVVGSPINPVDGEDTEANVEPSHISKVPCADQFTTPKMFVPVADLLDYIRSTFDDEEVLDSLPSEAAGNPGAWHAWKAHRRGGAGPGDLKRGSPHARLPGDWHWDGIWARRVEDEIAASHSDPMLFGNSARGSGDDMVGPSTPTD